jgi:exodeoxyribonuclease-3
MKIISYNVNGIRSAISKGFYTWLAEESPFLVGLQETKATADQVDLKPLEEMGYRHYWCNAEKKGYSGVAFFCQTEPDHVVYGMGNPEFDAEGRVLRADFGELTFLCVYFPSGTTGETRQTVKYRFLDAFFDFAQALRKSRPHLVVLGDYNIAHREVDIHDPKGNKNSTGFLPEERAWMDKWFSAGFSDSFRAVHPDLRQYSWWTFRANARANNKGWRIDYISVSEALASHVVGAELLNGAVHSDHCPCVLELSPPQGNG